MTHKHLQNHQHDDNITSIIYIHLCFVYVKYIILIIIALTVRILSFILNVNKISAVINLVIIYIYFTVIFNVFQENKTILLYLNIFESSVGSFMNV